MDKKEYMQKLEHYMKCYGYTPYDYFNQFALKLKGYMRYEFEDWEMKCPFLTDEDYKKLLYTDEENIIYYFATAMAKVIELNRLELKKDSDVKLLGGSNEVKLLPGKVEEKEEIHEEDSLSRKDIEDRLNPLD